MIDINIVNVVTIGIIAVLFIWAVKFLLAYFKVGQVAGA